MPQPPQHYFIVRVERSETHRRQFKESPLVGGVSNPDFSPDTFRTAGASLLFDIFVYIPSAPLVLRCD
ncbi:MAG: hypothetical protein OXI67_06020 [Candidatus Poribacteria bacterium]|nr:hypothetical protein [Candidatus Poribacteria bacterium]